MSGTPGFGGSSTTTSTRLAAELIIPTSRASPEPVLGPANGRTRGGETAARRGHNYVSLFIDLDCRRVLFATEGKDAATVAAFATDLAAHGGNPEAVAEVCIDMSPAFIAGAADSLPKAQITLDKFHVVELINEAVDEVRRAEQKSRTELNKSRYLWLKNPQNLSDRQLTQLESVSDSNLKTGRAYRMRLAFQ